MSRLAKIKTLGLSALLLGGMAAGGVVMAQDQQVPAHPANVLAGTCDNLDPVPKAQLSHVTVQVNDGEEQDANTPRGVLTASRVLLSSTEDVELPLEDILSSAHSISIYLVMPRSIPRSRAARLGALSSTRTCISGCGQ